MKGYKNSTKTVYETEPMVVYMRGGAVKAPPPKAKACAPVKDGPTSRPFAMGGYAKGGSAKKDMAQDKATVGKAVHKHERSMHPGKPLTKMQKGGKVGC